MNLRLKQRLEKVFENNAHPITTWDKLSILPREARVRDSLYIKNLITQLAAKPFSQLLAELQNEFKQTYKEYC